MDAHDSPHLQGYSTFDLPRTKASVALGTPYSKQLLWQPRTPCSRKNKAQPHYQMLIIGPWVDLGSASIRIPTLLNPPVKNRCQLSSGHTLSTDLHRSVHKCLPISFYRPHRPHCPHCPPKISARPGSPEFVSIQRCSCGLW